MTTTTDTALANRFRFRAWDKVKEKMFVPKKILWAITGLWLDDKCGSVEGTTPDDRYFGIDCGRMILMQSTGLTDKSGKEIFEGDVLEFEEPHFESAILKCPVVFYDGSFCAEWDRDGRVDWFLLAEIQEMEVIGNIYENPDLLPAI